MAQQQRVILDQDKFRCSICLDLLTEPVALPCGHSYCRSCIEGYWDQKREYSCPECRESFSPRPVLNVNNMLAEIVEKVRNPEGQQCSPSAAPVHVNPADVVCDFCTGTTRHKALMSCLVCLVSYCETHLQPHYNVPALKKHKLVPATARLQEKMCSSHDRLMELYCRTDQQCICYLCTMDEHKGHNTVPAAAERTEKQKQLVLSQLNAHLKIQERKKELIDLRQAIEILKTSAKVAVEASDKIFSEMIVSIMRRRSEVKKLILDQEKTAVAQAEGLLRQLEEEVAKLERRHAELEELSNTDDIILFIQSYQSLNSSSGYPVLPSIVVHPLHSFTGVSDAVSGLSDKLNNILTTTWPEISERIFGTSTSRGGLFGDTNTTCSSGGLLGNTNTTTTTSSSGGLFGDTNSTSSNGGLFGNTNTTTTTTSSRGGLFGNTNTTTTTSSSGGLFGDTNTTFSSGGLFGDTNTTFSSGGLFGDTNTTFSSGGLFGDTNTTCSSAGLLGNVNTTFRGLFGNINTTSSSAGLFGNTNTTTTSSEGLFRNTNTLSSSGGLFGNTNTTTSSGGLFRNTNTTTSSGGLFGNTNTTTSSGGLFGNINTTTTSRGGLFGNTNTTTSSGGLFGNTNTTTSSGGLFGNINTTTTSSEGLFRNTNTTTSSGGLFGNTNTTTSSGGLFGNINTTTTSRGGLFGNTNTTTSSGGLFGNTNTTTSSGGLFRNTNTTTSSGGLFGNINTTTTTSSGGLFGNINTTTTTTSSGGLFGNTNTSSGGGLLGNISTTSSLGGTSISSTQQPGTTLKFNVTDAPTIDYTDEQPKTEQLAIRFKAGDEAALFKTKFVEAQKLVPKSPEKHDQQEKKEPEPTKYPATFGAEFALTGEWDCNVCCVRNIATAAKCVACLSNNPNSSTRPDSNETKGLTGESLSAGDLTNKFGIDSKPINLESTFTGLGSSVSSSFKCGTIFTCAVRNEVSVSCVSCQTPNPAVKTASTASTASMAPLFSGKPNIYSLANLDTWTTRGDLQDGQKDPNFKGFPHIGETKSLTGESLSAGDLTIKFGIDSKPIRLESTFTGLGSSVSSSFKCGTIFTCAVRNEVSVSCVSCQTPNPSVKTASMAPLFSGKPNIYSLANLDTWTTRGDLQDRQKDPNFKGFPHIGEQHLKKALDDTASRPITKNPFHFGESTGGFSFSFQANITPSKTPTKLNQSRASVGTDDEQDVTQDRQRDFPDFKSVTPLPDLVNISTGEENEQVVFCHRAKLYRYDEDLGEWKERGIGDLKILQNYDTRRVRLIMRRSQVLKLCANHWIKAAMKLEPMKSSEKAWVWCAMDFAEGTEGKVEQLAVRFKLQEVANMFKDIFEEAKAKEGLLTIVTSRVATPQDTEASVSPVRCSKLVFGTDSLQKIFGSHKSPSETEASCSKAKDSGHIDQASPATPEFNTPDKAPPQAEGGNAGESDRDVEVVYVRSPTAEQASMARKLLLPHTFFCYKNEPGYTSDSQTDDDEDYESAVTALNGKLYADPERSREKACSLSACVQGHSTDAA